MPRNDQISRQWKIMRLIEQRRFGISVPDIAKELNCNVRTIYRDIEAISYSGFPIFDEKLDGVQVWKSLRGPSQNLQLPLDPTELVALFVARDHLKAFDGTPFASSLKSAFEKMRSTLRPEMQAFVGGLTKVFRVGLAGRKDYSCQQKISETINDAILKKFAVEILYRFDRTMRVIEPYCVWFVGGTIYVVSYCRKRNAMRLFMLDRIKSAKLTDSSFEVPADFSMDDFTKDRFYVFGGDGLHDVRIRFSKGVADAIKETVWHPSQMIDDEQGGSIILRMNVEGLEDVKSWVLSFGRSAKVLQPIELVDEIRKESKAVAALY